MHQSAFEQKSEKSLPVLYLVLFSSRPSETLVIRFMEIERQRGHLKKKTRRMGVLFAFARFFSVTQLFHCEIVP